MKISIITVTCNSAQTLQATVNSVLSQSYQNIEYIIVDGNSTDGTLDIIKENEPKFNGKMKWISESDSGIYDAMNKGIAMATGEIVGILNSDDFFFNTEILSEINSLFEKESCDVLYGDLIYQNEIKSIRHWKSNQFRTNSLYYGWMPPHPTLYCKRSLYNNDIGIFDSKFRISADYDLILRIFKNDELKSVYFPQVMIVMSQGGISNASLKSKFLKSKEDYLVLRKNNINFPILVVFLKNIRKIYQFVRAKTFYSSPPTPAHSQTPLPKA